MWNPDRYYGHCPADVAALVSYNEPKEQATERRYKIGSGQLCFFCWAPTENRPIAYDAKGCQLVLCAECTERPDCGFPEYGMKWWAESQHNPFSIKNKRKAAKKT